MNPESVSEKSRTQSKTSPKRAHRANRNRPVLVTEQEQTNTSAGEQDAQAHAEAMQPEVALTPEETSSGKQETARRRGPRFFANIGKTEAQDHPQADPKRARLARALRGKLAASPKEEPAKEKKAAPAREKAGSTSTRPPAPRFKGRYIWGMVIYLLIADFLGIALTNLLRANHLDVLLFTLGPVQATSSTVLFLILLVVILIVMARLDLIPRSFGAMAGGSARSGALSRSKTSSSKTNDAPTFETKAPQPSIKQGIKGADDDLYKEYRENQRYFQRRDRKR
jgi:hypothetical protein